MQLEPSLSDLTAMESIGCDACEQTGYKGAVYLTDLIWADKALREMIANGPSRYDLANHIGDYGDSLLNQLTTLIVEGKISVKEAWSWI